jgi:hypothetical protein
VILGLLEEVVVMVAHRSRRRGVARSRQVLQKPHGVIHPRVQQVGPEHFGIVSVDCAKARSKWMLGNFYGDVLVPPTTVAHIRPDLEAAATQLRQAVEQYQLRDVWPPVSIGAPRTGGDSPP